MFTVLKQFRKIFQTPNENDELSDLLQQRFTDSQQMYFDMHNLCTAKFHTIHLNDFAFDNKLNQLSKEEKDAFQEEILKNALLNVYNLTEQEISIFLPNGKLSDSIFEILKNTESIAERAMVDEAKKKLELTKKADGIILAGGGYIIDKHNFMYSLELFKLVSEGIEKIRQGSDLRATHQKIVEKINEISETLKPTGAHGEFGRDMDKKVYAALHRAQNTGIVATEIDKKLLLIAKNFKSAQETARSDKKDLRAFESTYQDNKKQLIEAESKRLHLYFKSSTTIEREAFVSFLEKSYGNEKAQHKLYFLDNDCINRFLENGGEERNFKDLIRDKYIEEYLSDDFQDKRMSSEKTYNKASAQMKQEMEDKYKSALKNIIIAQLESKIEDNIINIEDNIINNLFVQDSIIDIQELKSFIGNPQEYLAKQRQLKNTAITKDKKTSKETPILSPIEKPNTYKNMQGRQECTIVDRNDLMLDIKNNMYKSLRIHDYQNKIDDHMNTLIETGGDFKPKEIIQSLAQLVVKSLEVDIKVVESNPEWQNIRKLILELETRFSNESQQEGLLAKIWQAFCQLIEKCLGEQFLSDEYRVKYLMNEKTAVGFIGKKLDGFKWQDLIKKEDINKETILKI